MEIIAKRGLFKAIIGGMLAVFGFWMLLGALLSYLFPESPDDIYTSITFLVIGIIAVIASIPFYVKHYQVPKYLVWYENGLYHFPDFECKSEFIKNANFKIKYSLDGDFIVTTRDGATHVYKNVQNVGNAQFLLMLTILHDEGYLNG